MTKAEFIQHIKNHMKNCKNSWINQYFTVDGHKVGLKMWMDRTKASVYRFEIDGLQTPSAHDLTQKNTVAFIEDYLSRA